jgi:hypothetical protein
VISRIARLANPILKVKYESSSDNQPRGRPKEDSFMTASEDSNTRPNWLEHPSGPQPLGQSSTFNENSGHTLGDRVERRAVNNLYPHPALIRHRISPSLYKIEALIKSHHLDSCAPLVITPDGLIIDGNARWELARRQGRIDLPCVSLNVTQEEALEHLLHNQSRSVGLNAFLRIELALELEPWLREKAVANQSTGGRNKGSTTLPEAYRIDVRKRIAAIACASVGNVGKVKYLRSHAAPELNEALRDGRVTISRAFLWAKMSPKDQSKALLEWERNRAARSVISLVRRRSRSEDATAPDAVATVRALGIAMTATPELYPVTILQIEGRGIFITHELAISLTNEKDSVR